MQLRIASLGQFVTRHDGVLSLRAEDASGSFGLRPGCGDFLTVLEVGVISWRAADGAEHHCAVRGGVLRAQAGATIDVVSREAILDDDLARLESTVLAAFRQRDEAERQSRTESQRMELQMAREFSRYLRPQLPGRGGPRR